MYTHSLHEASPLRSRNSTLSEAEYVTPSRSAVSGSSLGSAGDLSPGARPRRYWMKSST